MARLEKSVSVTSPRGKEEKQTDAVFEEPNDSKGMFQWKYKIVKKLGHGSEGKVYLAHDRQTGEEVAVKIVKNLDTYIKLKQVYREAMILKDLAKMEGSKYI